MPDCMRLVDITLQLRSACLKLTVQLSALTSSYDKISYQAENIIVRNNQATNFSISNCGVKYSINVIFNTMLYDPGHRSIRNFVY